MRLRTLFTAGTLVAALLAGAAPAGAHDGEGIITLEAAHPAGTSVHFIVRVTWENDGHAATGATVTATALGADGTRLTPVTLAPIDDDGRYANPIEFDGAGTWRVRFTSIEPTGTSEVTQEVTAPTSTTATTDDGTTGTTSADDAGGFAPADDGTGSSGEAAAGDNDGGGMPVWLVVGAAVVVVGGAIAAVRTARRYRTGPGSPAGPAEPAET
jgi:hypothetical protein